jgi:hypothetical protein
MTMPGSCGYYKPTRTRLTSVRGLECSVLTGKVIDARRLDKNKPMNVNEDEVFLREFIWAELQKIFPLPFPPRMLRADAIHGKLCLTASSDDSAVGADFCQLDSDIL